MSNIFYETTNRRPNVEEYNVLAIQCGNSSTIILPQSLIGQSYNLYTWDDTMLTCPDILGDFYNPGFYNVPLGSFDVIVLNRREQYTKTTEKILAEELIQFMSTVNSLLKPNGRIFIKDNYTDFYKLNNWIEVDYQVYGYHEFKRQVINSENNIVANFVAHPASLYGIWFIDNDTPIQDYIPQNCNVTQIDTNTFDPTTWNGNYDIVITDTIGLHNLTIIETLLRIAAGPTTSEEYLLPRQAFWKLAIVRVDSPAVYQQFAVAKRKKQGGNQYSYLSFVPNKKDSYPFVLTKVKMSKSLVLDKL